jgi:hypothetical protein
LYIHMYTEMATLPGFLFHLELDPLL